MNSPVKIVLYFTLGVVLILVPIMLFWMYGTVNLFESSYNGGDFQNDPTISPTRPRIYSPDKSRMLLFYTISEGAWDGGNCESVAITSEEELDGTIERFSLPCWEWDDIDWKGNDTVVVIRGEGSIDSIGEFSVSDTTFALNGVVVEVYGTQDLDL